MNDKEQIDALKAQVNLLAVIKAKVWEEGYWLGVADERTSELIRQQAQAHYDRMGVNEIIAKKEPARSNPYKS